MKKITASEMKKLSFPDMEVEKMFFSNEEKSLKIFVDGAWLDVNDGEELGRGILLFNNWESLCINRFDLEGKSSCVELSAYEELKDLCEVIFSDHVVSLCGFGKDQGLWLEWKIVNAEMHAEFENATI